jgi:hypothetical protein
MILVFTLNTVLLSYTLTESQEMITKEFSLQEVIVDATNNWWGTNNPYLSTNTSTTSDIYYKEAPVAHPVPYDPTPLWWIEGRYDPYLKLNLTSSTIVVTHNSTSASEVTADINP